MKILHTVEYYHPVIGGMPEVVKQLSERLVKLGHEVTIATTDLPERKEKILNGVNIVSFKIQGKMVEGLTGGIDAYKNFLINSDFDIITNFAAQQWATDIMLPILSRIKAGKVLVPTGFSSLYQPLYEKYFENMKIWMKKYDMNVFLSNDYRDINFARHNNIHNIMVIPNGAGKDEFLNKSNIDIKKILHIPQSDFLILHVGSHTGLKGHNEAIKIFSKTKIKNVTLLIISDKISSGCVIKCKIQEKLFNHHPARLIDKKKLILQSFARSETIAAYKQADLFLFPTNIECSPLVLFECMASKTPFLVTDAGNAQEIIRWSNGAGELLQTFKNKQGFSFAEINSSAILLEQICKSSGRRKKMTQNGYKAWLNTYNWEKIVKEYEKLYISLLKK